MRLDGLEISPRAMYITDMTGETPRRLKRPRDPNQLAKLIVDIATGQVDDREPTPKEAVHRSRRVDRGDMKKTAQKREP
jgi:hypothetical protein